MFSFTLLQTKPDYNVKLRKTRAQSFRNRPKKAKLRPFLDHITKDNIMGLLDSITSLAGAAALLKDTDGNGQIQAVDLVKQLIEQNGGNVGALLGQLQQGNLADTVQSWIGNGANAPADAAQIQNALGGNLQEAAAKVGLDVNQAGNLLAQYLPQIVNGLTPNGNAADANGFGLDDIAGMLINNFLKK